MRLRNALNVLILIFAVASRLAAQSSETTPETVAKLRLQLIEIQMKDEELRGRLRLLEEELQPQNIERALAGIGSTKPEELRERRRRELTLERNNASALLKVLEASRAGLEAAIVAAETRAYHQSAYPEPPANRLVMPRNFAVASSTLAAICGLVLILAATTTGFVALRKRIIAIRQLRALRSLEM
jgi:hypothetical protein